ncbi:MAG TPA: hypothetical protein VFZ48_05770 [Candidatus Saccharimonadales bacterium]
MDANRPTKKQRELLTFIDGFIKMHGYGPSYREVMRALNYKSVSTVATHINGLIAKGHLAKRDHSPRSIEVVASSSIYKPQKQTIESTDVRWLLAQIEERFRKAEANLEEKLIDDLFVLVGALHVLGLDEAHLACKSRLLALVREQS